MSAEIVVERLTPVSLPVDDAGDRVVAIFNASVGDFRLVNATLVRYRDGQIKAQTRDREGEPRCRIRLRDGETKDRLNASVRRHYEREMAHRAAISQGGH